MTGAVFDSHAHYDDEAFDSDRDSVLSSLTAKGITGVIDCGCNLKSCLKAVELAEKYSFVYAAVGVHGQDSAEVSEEDYDSIEKLYSHEKVVAVGEIGLDYHYDYSPRDVQLEAFERQLALSVRLGLPVIVHDREAHEDTMRLLTKYRPKGVVHCFSGSAEMAAQVVSLGMYVGLGGAVTFKNARKPLEVARTVPEDRILLETDCPYMTPVPFRGKRNDSTLIPYSAAVIASLRGVETEYILNITEKNARELFRV